MNQPAPNRYASAFATQAEFKRYSLAYRDTIPYPPEKIRQYCEELRTSPWVRPSLKAGEDLMLGYSPGWTSPPDFADVPSIPPQPIYGYRIADHDSPDLRTTLVVTCGNHGREVAGDWVLHGLIDLLVSDRREAAVLRQHLLVCVYPNLNPEGRYQYVHDLLPAGAPVPSKHCGHFNEDRHHRANAELHLAGEDDHNRVWDTHGRFTTIDLLTAAMRADTGGHADFLWDLHGPQEYGNWRSPQGRPSWDCPYGKALIAREPEVVTAGLPDSPYKSRIGFDPSKLSVWAASPEGFNVPHTYVYEPGHWTRDRLLEAGANLGLALYDLLDQG